MIEDSLLRFRPEFPILGTTTYLISNSLGAMPRAAARSLSEYAETWSTRGVRAWADSWWEMSVSVGDEIAPLLGAPPRAPTFWTYHPSPRGAASPGPACCSTPTSRLGPCRLRGRPGRGSGDGRRPQVAVRRAGGAFLYVRPEARAALRPALTGWMAHPAPFDFEPPPMRYRDDAFRFLLGTPAILALYAAREGPCIVREAGMEAIREKSLRQTARLLELAEARGLSYTEDSELGRAFAVLDEIRASGSWRRWQQSPATVT